MPIDIKDVMLDGNIQGLTVHVDITEPVPGKSVTLLPRDDHLLESLLMKRVAGIYGAVLGCSKDRYLEYFGSPFAWGDRPSSGPRPM